MIYVADMDNSGVRSINLTSGLVSSLAGRSTGTIGAVDGVGQQAYFDMPENLRLTADGTSLVVSDTGNNCIRVIRIDTANVTTLAGDISLGAAGKVDGVGKIARFNTPTGLSVTSNGLIYVADYMNNLIRVINITSQNVTTLAGTGVAGKADSLTGLFASFRQPNGVAYISTPTPSLYVADTYWDILRSVSLEGANPVYTIAGSSTAGGQLKDGVGLAARFFGLNDVFPSENAELLFIADMSNNAIRMINVSSVNVTTIGGTNSFNSPRGVALLYEIY